MFESQVFLDRRSSSAKKIQYQSPSFVVSNRVKSYKDNFAETYQSAKKHSNVYGLASDIYSKSVGNRYTIQSKKEFRSFPSNPEKDVQTLIKGNNILRMSLVRSEKSISKIRTMSPGDCQSDALLQNLGKRAGMLGQFKKGIDDLNSQKDKTLHKIEELKRKIHHQKKLRTKLSLRSDKYMNSTEHALDYRTNVKRETSRNKDSQEEHEQACQRLHDCVQELDQRSLAINKLILEQQALIREYEQETSNLKHKVFGAKQQLVETKANLTVSLKAMKNCNDIVKYLESQKADLLLQVNNETEQNKVSVM